jgi:CheY-like chemotaxis protein
MDCLPPRTRHRVWPTDVWTKISLFYSTTIAKYALMPKRILDVGNCQPDHAALKTFLTGHFDCAVVQAHGWDDARAELREGGYDLVLVNRKLDRDYSDGIDIIRRIKSDPDLAGVACMLITNYSEHQDAAEQAGALRGFGKLEYQKPETFQKLQQVLA